MVVDLLEVVHVHRIQREGAFVAARPVAFGGDPLAQAAHVRDSGQRIDESEVAVVAGDQLCSLLGHHHRCRDYRERAGRDERVRNPRGPFDRKLGEEYEHGAPEHVGEREPPRIEVTRRGNDQQGYQGKRDDLAVHDQHGRHEDGESGYQPGVRRQREDSIGALQMSSREDTQRPDHDGDAAQIEDATGKQRGIDRIEHGDEQPAAAIKHRRGVPGRPGREPHLGELGREIGRAVVGARCPPRASRASRARNSEEGRVQPRFMRSRCHCVNRRS